MPNTAKKQTPAHTILRNETYWFQKHLPSDLWGNFDGKKRIQISLKTKDRFEANVKATQLDHQLRLQITALRAKAAANENLFAELESIYATHTGDIVQSILDDAKKVGLKEQATLMQHAAEISALTTTILIEKGLPQIAQQFDARFSAKGSRGLLISDFIDEFITQDGTSAKTKAQRKTSIKRLADRFPRWSDISLKQLNDWIKDHPRAKKTKQRELSDWRMYWAWLMREERVTGPNPFEHVLILGSSVRQSTADQDREAFSEDEISNLLGCANANQDQTLHDLIILAVYTGCRIEELCSLRDSDIAEIDSILCVDIKKGKTASAVRQVPLHTDIKMLARRLKEQSCGGLLFAGGGMDKYGKYSPAFSKRFTRLRNELGLPSTKVFHSLRKTTATLLQRAGVDEGTAAELLGHKKQTMTYGLYSAGMTMAQKLAAIEKIKVFS